MNRADVFHLFASQHDVASRKQLESIGVSPSTIGRALRRGDLALVLPGIVQPTSRKLTFEGKVMACQLFCGPTSYATGTTAGALYGMDGMPRAPVRMATRKRLRATPPLWLRVAYRPKAPRQDVMERADGLRVARANPMLLEIADEVDQARFLRIAEDAWRQGLITPASVARYLAEQRRQGKHGVACLEHWLELTEPRQRPTGSGFEIDVIEKFVAVGLPEPERQYPLVLPDGTPIHLDVAWPEITLAVEPGHSWWHGGNERMLADQRRDRLCGRLGWQVIRFGEEARDDLRGAALEVREIYETRRTQLLRPDAGHG